MRTLIRRLTSELACYHEAGHIVVALSADARVVEVELYNMPPPPHARTRVDRTDEQAKVIALGGFLAEYHLFVTKRYVDEHDRPLSEKDFIHEAVVNAVSDRVSYFEGDFERENGTWPPEMDRSFISAAIGLHDRGVDFDLLERLADELLAKGRLGESDIKEVIMSTQSSRP